MDIDEFLIHSTIRIEAYLPGELISTGTGFFFTFFHDEKEKVPVIITNKHVIENAESAILHFSLQENDQFLEKEFLTYELSDVSSVVIMHPEEDVDLCIIPIAPLHNAMDIQNKRLYYTELTKDNLLTDEYLQENISNVEDITVVGYPDGIWDAVNNLPIVRKGITATSLKYDFNGAPRFLIDSAIYGGSSGSPVFIFNQGSYTIKNRLVEGNRFILVGIVSTVAQHTLKGEIKFMNVADLTSTLAQTNIPNNLGVVIKAHKILDFEDILRDEIERIDESVYDGMSSFVDYLDEDDELLPEQLESYDDFF